MFGRVILFLFLLSLSQGAAAGPWLREKGKSFTAASVAGTYYLETATQTYIEYGLTETTTIIADIGMAQSYALGQSGSATLSLRRAIGTSDAPYKLAYEVGVGAGWIGEFILPHLRTGLSWGRGITLQDKTGWMTVEGAVIWDLTHSLHVAKVDATVGLNFTETTTGMLQIYTLHDTNQSIATLAPSLVFTPKTSKFRLQIGSESQIGNFGNSALKFGIWREF